MRDDEALADLNAAGEDLLRLYEMADVSALLVTFDGETIVVRCQNSSDVLTLCRKVIAQYDSPADRTVN